MNPFSFALRSLRRDLASGEVRVLALALLIAVASVSAIGFFTDRIGERIRLRAAEILAADSLIRSGSPLDETIQAEADRLGLTTATTVQFPSVVLTEDDDSQLVSVKAVSEGYPLRGALSLQPAEGGESLQRPAIPTPGTLWVDQQLAGILQLVAGDELVLGDLSFVVTQLITYEPDRGDNIFELAPRVMINEADLAAARLIGEGSRARYALLITGDASAVSELNEFTEQNFIESVRVQSVRDGSERMRNALERAESFLGLASVVTVLLAAAAVALAVRQFARNQADASAVLRTLGASRRDVMQWMSLRLLIIAFLASLLGVALGWLAQWQLGAWLHQWFQIELPPPTLMPAMTGMLTALLTLLGFGLLPIVRAASVSVMRVLQRDYTGLAVSTSALVISSIVAAFLIVYLQSGGLLLSLIVTGGVLAMLGLFALVGRGLIALIRRLTHGQWRLAVAGLSRRAGSSVLQLAAFAIGIMALLLIGIVRNDLLEQWQRSVPDTAPNAFVVNIQPSQTDAIRQQMIADGITDPELHPMIRARLVGSNGKQLLRDENVDSHQRRHARFEYNLTWASALPAGNEIVEGEWWSEDQQDDLLLSLEEDWAEHQNYKIGDTLTFRVAGQDVTGTVSNIRSVDWESFEVNFFIVGTQALLDELPRTYLTSFKLDEDFGKITNAWVRAFPGIVALDVGAMITRVRGMMDQAALAVEYVFIFTLVAGIVVLLAAVQSSQGERRREAALLRTLGASHAQLRRAIITEFAILGVISGIVASLFATIIAWAVSRFVFELPFDLNPWLWLVAVIFGGAGIALSGYLATRRVLFTPPAIALRAE